MPEHVARLELTAAARSGAGHGALLRVATVRAALTAAGYVVDDRRQACLGVAVSFATAGRVRRLSAQVPAVWLDVTDSWLLTDGSGLRSGDLSYGLRLLRDGSRLARMPEVDLVTWISGADRSADRGTVRGRTRLVLPQAPVPPVAAPAVPDAPGRLVLSGDWHYPPNRAGLDWFGRAVAPLVDVRTVLFGAGAPSGPWEVMGYAEDEADLYREGDLHVAPVRFGAGVKNKVLRPLLAGLPVLTTPQGAHGLRPHPLLRVSSTAAGFAAVVRGWQVHPLAAAAPRAGDLLDADDTDEVAAWLVAQQRRCVLH